MSTSPRTRTAPSLVKGRDPRCRVAFDSKLPSAGLSLTTPWGPVDLVAIGQALRGKPVVLDAADEAWLRERTHYSYGRNLAADLLEIRRSEFTRLLERWRRNNPTLTAEA